MPHRNKIQDSEPHFIINPSARTITNSSADNNIIVQYDHNSERFTFEIPRYVDGHDMSECIENGEVRVNYRNSASTGLSKNDGVYVCNDLAVSTDDEDIVTFSWLLSSAATQYIGYLYFSVQFICFDGDNIAYSWNTGIYKDITIVESINNVEEAVVSDSFKELTDLIRNAKETLGSVESAISNANTAADTARASAHYIEKADGGRFQILDGERNVIDTVDVFTNTDKWEIANEVLSHFIDVSGEWTISFTVGDSHYTALYGMTWYEWVNSAFNTDGFTCIGDNDTVRNPDNYEFGDDEDRTVYGYFPIMPDMAYFIYEV